MNCNGYIPHPVDISSIQLPEELIELAEAISKNVHEVWSQNHMDEGWTYGPVRNDENVLFLMRNYPRLRKHIIAIQLSTLSNT